VNGHQQELARRRRELLERSAAQRSALVANAEPLLRKAAALDRIVAVVRRHSVVAGLAVGAVALLGSRQLFAMTTRLLSLYMLFRR
jgi:hypothetical protein